MEIDTSLHELADQLSEPSQSKNQESDENAPVAEQMVERNLTLPMGTWLGFHDGNMPMMARLAVHDTEDDKFIFVNRKGIKLRELSKAQMLRLIDDGMVDILQRSSSFRDEVTEVRKNLEK